MPKIAKKSGTAVETSPVEVVLPETDATEDVVVAVPEIVSDAAESPAPVEDVPSENETPGFKKGEVIVRYDKVAADAANIPEEKARKVRIRMRVDHSCTIAMVRYNLKAGCVYDVPQNVRRILQEAGLLAPL